MLLCGAANGRATIEVAFGHTSYDLQPLFTRFEKETGHLVSTALASEYDLKAELVKRRRKKRLPDVFIAPADYASIPSLKLVTTNSDWLDPNLSEKALQTVLDNGKPIAVPLILGNHLLLYYNKTMIDTPVKHFKDMLKQKSDLPGNARLISWAFSGMYFFIPFLSAFDAMPIQHGQLTLNTPGMSKALEFYWSLPEQGLAQPQCDSSCYPQYFAESKFAYVIDGIWSLQQYQNALGDDLGIAVLPAINGQPMRPYFSSHVFTVLEAKRSPETLEAIRQLARFLQTEESQTWLWDNVKALPVNSIVLNRIRRSDDPNIRAIVTQLEQADAIPLNPHMAVIWEALSKGFNRYGADMLSAEQSAMLMQHLAARTMERQQWQ